MSACENGKPVPMRISKIVNNFPLAAISLMLSESYDKVIGDHRHAAKLSQARELYFLSCW